MDSFTRHMKPKGYTDATLAVLAVSVLLGVALGMLSTLGVLSDPAVSGLRLFFAVPFSFMGFGILWFLGALSGGIILLKSIHCPMRVEPEPEVGPNPNDIMGDDDVL